MLLWRFVFRNRIKEVILKNILRSIDFHFVSVNNNHRSCNTIINVFVYIVLIMRANYFLDIKNCLKLLCILEVNVYF